METYFIIIIVKVNYLMNNYSILLIFKQKDSI